MDINWLGHAAFSIQTKTASIVIDPFDEQIGLPWRKQAADILLVSHEHLDHNNQAGVDAQFTAEGPGEYEVKEVAITGTQLFHDASKGEQRGRVTAYSIEADNITICHLSDLGHKLSGEQVEELPSVDILMIPVGGKYTIDGATAAEVVNQLEPQIVIPMHYQIPGLKLDEELDGFEPFMKALGKETWETQSVLKVGNRDSLGGELKVVVLEPKK